MYLTRFSAVTGTSCPLGSNGTSLPSLVTTKLRQRSDTSPPEMGGVGCAWKHRAGKLENPKKIPWFIRLSWFIVVNHHFHSFPALTPLFSGGNSYFQTHILFAGPVMMLPSTPSWLSPAAWGPGCSSWAAANLQTRPRESSYGCRRLLMIIWMISTLW